MIAQRRCLPGMRSLAAHFVRGEEKIPHIFHPCYDMRERFVDLDALRVNLTRRRIHGVDLEKVAYCAWANVGKAFSNL